MNPPDHPQPRFAVSSLWRMFPSGMRRRWWLFRLFDLLARHWPVVAPKKGVIVVRMDGIGDMVLFRGSLDYYAEALGVEKSQITIIGCKSWGAIADNLFQGYRVIAINEHAYAKKPFYRFKISLMVRRLNPEIAVCDAYFRRAMMADSLVWISGATRSIVSLPHINEPTRAEFTWYLSQVSQLIDTGPYPTHEVVRHFDFISQLAGTAFPPRPPVIEWRGGLSPSGGAVVLNPGSNEPGRRWPFESYLGLARRLLDAGHKVAFVGTHGENEAREAIASLNGGDRVIDLFGRTTMPQLMDVMVQAALVVSNDSGPAHLAVALGVPTLVIVGGGHFGCFFPYPEGVAPPKARFVFHETECYHCFWRCHLRTDPKAAFPCIEAVGDDQVWRAVVELLPPKTGASNG